MLPKKFRITFFDFRKNSQRADRLNYLLLTFLIKKSNSKNIRFVIIVPKSLDGRSSYRHLSKRIIAESLRPYINRDLTAVDVLIKPKKIIGKNERVMVEKEIAGLFGRLREIA